MKGNARQQLPRDELEALADFVARREADPPWQFARELSAEGLVRNLGLTPRGRRSHATARG